MFSKIDKISRLIIILLCGSITFSDHSLSIAKINSDFLVEWNNLCYSTKHVLCKTDRLYIFPFNVEKKTFNQGREWCKSLAPCKELGDLISIRNCDQLNDIVNLTNKFINDNEIIEADVQVWTSRLRDLEHEQNLVISCLMKTKLDLGKIADSNYSILEIETPHIYIRNTKEGTNYQSQLGYVLCEIMKPTIHSVCKKIVESKQNDSKFFDKSSTTTITNPPIQLNHFNWSNIDKMFTQNKTASDILDKIDEKIDFLMEHGSIINLINRIERLNENLIFEEFEKENKKITSTMMKIFSATLDKKYIDSWNKINFTQRKNASIQIIIQMNNLIEHNFCLLKENDEFEINLNTTNYFKHKNCLESDNILIEAFKLRKNLTSDFSFPSIRLSENLKEIFYGNKIYFPKGLNLNHINLNNSRIRCKNKIENNYFATGMIYKNLAEYLHYGRSFNEKPISMISMSSIDKKLNFSNWWYANWFIYSAHINNGEKKKKYDSYVLNSYLIGFTFNNIIEKSVKLNKSVRIQIEHLKYKHRLDILKCVFYNFTIQEWDDDGCHLVFNTKFYSICECDHLTNFAVLMDISGREQESSVKSALSMFCSILSIIGLSITIIVFTFIPKLRSKRNLITANLCFNLLLVNILVGFFLEIESELLCKIISIVLFYFLINSFCWMFIQGYFFYQMIVLVFSNSSYFRLKHMILYSNGFSLLWLIIVLAIIGQNGFYDYENSYFCWFSNRNEPQNFWFFFAPVLVICVFNLAIVILSFKETYKASKRRIKLSYVPKKILNSKSNSLLEINDKSNKFLNELKYSENSKNSSAINSNSDISISKVKSWFRGWFTLILLLGLTWIVGFLMIIDIYRIASYIFILLNSLQGFYIFLFEICLNIKSRTTIIKIIRDKIVVHYMIITSKENQKISTKTISSTITPISDLITTNDKSEIDNIYLSRISTSNMLKV